MIVARRTALYGLAALALMGPAGRIAGAQRRQPMFGLIGKMIAVPGQRDALIDILLEATGGMPGCLIYVVARDASDTDAIWITEVWDSETSHKASLTLPAVRAAIAKGRPLIKAFESQVTTIPVGGQGLPA